MAVILSIETSTKVGSVSLHAEGQLLLYYESFLEKSHSENLVRRICNILEETKIKPEEVDAVAVSKGPGSYTGLRIGVSAAKGFCYPFNIPLISVDTLLSMAYEVKMMGISDGLLCPMIDARRMEVYSKVFDNKLDSVSEVEAIIVDEDKFDHYFERHKIYFFGNGSEKCKTILLKDRAFFLEGIYPKAKNIGALAFQKFEHKEFENLAYFEPYYLKEFMIKKASGRNLV